MPVTAMDQIGLLSTAVVSIYILWRFAVRYASQRQLHDVYYMMGFLVLLFACVLWLWRGPGILASPYVLSISSLIPLGISMGIAEQFFPSWKRAFKWLALVGFVALSLTSIGQMPFLKKMAVPLFHGAAGLVIILGPFFAPRAASGFRWVAIGGLLIGLGGFSLAVISAGSQFLFLSSEVVMGILPALLLGMSLAFTWGFMKDIRRPSAP
jgi:hypothetical protein